MKHEFEVMKANPESWPEGLDNRADKLHPARFAGPLGISIFELYKAARKVWGPHGVKAIINFDLTGIRLSGCITTKAWVILHNPGSDELSIKLFSIKNIRLQASARQQISLEGDNRIVVAENWKDLTEMSEVKAAFKNMMKAARVVRWWDYSFEVLECFLLSSNFMDSDLQGYRKATMVQDYIDHVLQLNANRWIEESCFLTIAEMQPLWASFWASQKSAAPRFEQPQKQPGQKDRFPNRGPKKHENRPQQQQNQKQQPAKKAKKLPPLQGDPSLDNICTREVLTASVHMDNVRCKRNFQK
jgi:hypothetical protein